MVQRQSQSGAGTGSKRLSAGLLLGVFAVALLVRAGWGSLQLVRANDPSSLQFPDEQQYWEMAELLRGGEGLKDELGFRATRMPLYPAALSLFAAKPGGVIGAKACQWAAGALVAVLTAGLAATLIDGRVGLAAGLLVALDPFLVFFSSLLLTETAFMVALLALWWLLWRVASAPQRVQPWRRWFAVGIAGAFCVYLRESSLGLLLVALCFVAALRRFELRTIVGAAIAVGMIGAALIPWGARNRNVTGDWCWLTHRAGISLYDGVGPQASGASDLGEIKQMPAVAGLSEVEWNRYFLHESFAAMKENPRRIVRLALVKIARTWNPLPNVVTEQSALVRVVSASWTVPTFAFAIAGAVLLAVRNGPGGGRTVLFLLLPALYFTALHSVFVGSVRYRLPAIPMIEMLAAVALVALIGRVRERRSTERSRVGFGPRRR